MRLEFYPVEKLKKEILERVGKHLDLGSHRIFFFGSRVTGRGDARSDIDVGIEGPRPLLSKVFQDIEEDFEDIPTLYKIELVDFKHVGRKFRETAIQEIEIIN